MSSDPTLLELLEHGQIMSLSISQSDEIIPLQHHLTIIQKKSTTTWASTRTRTTWELSFSYKITWIKLSVIFYKKKYYGYAVITEKGPMFQSWTINSKPQSHRFTAKISDSDLSWAFWNLQPSFEDDLRKVYAQEIYLFKIYGLQRVKVLFRKRCFKHHRQLSKYIKARKQLEIS